MDTVTLHYVPEGDDCEYCGWRKENRPSIETGHAFTSEFMAYNKDPFGRWKKVRLCREDVPKEPNIFDMDW